MVLPTSKKARHTNEIAVLHNLVADLNERIANAQYPLHSKLPPERILSNRLGVSRSTLRRALKTLESQGQIWRHVGKGTFVGRRPTSVHSSPELLGANTSLSELLEARLLIEPLVARLAAMRAQPRDVALLRTYHESVAASHDWFSFDAWDELFHRAIAEASGNALMISVIDRLFQIKRDSKWCIARARSFDVALMKSYSSQHAEVMSAIRRRDINGAGAAMRRHITAISYTLGPCVDFR